MLDAEELKLQLGSRAKDIIANGLNLKENSGKKVICPLHNDKVPSMSWFENGNMWRCNACQENIDIYRYYTDFKNMTFIEAKETVNELLGNSKAVFKKAPKGFVKPNIRTKPLAKPFIEYMQLRGITEETLNALNVKQTTWAGNEVYVFQYLNEEKELEYVSYRGLGKNGIKGGCEPNTKSILWGMDTIDKTKPLVITEGQPDRMVVWQCGYKNVVSVPNGSQNFKWIDHNWEWLQDIKEFIVWADNDEPGLAMAKNIKNKLNNVKILVADKKDANEVLHLDGAEKVLQLVKDIVNATPEGLIDVSQLEYKSAIELAVQGIETGFLQYDRHVEDWKPGEITIVQGRNGEGKTTVISQIIAHCLERAVPTFLYSGEMSEFKIQDWLYRQMIGNKKEYLRTIVTKYKNKQEPKPEIVKVIKEWHKDLFYLFDRNVKDVMDNLDHLFNMMELAAKRYGVRIFFIDNLMAVLEENADSLYSDQANLVQRGKNFAINNDVHVVFLAHPNKTKKEIGSASSGNLEKGDISGTNNIPNKADNIIAVERLWGANRESDAIITSLKDRETGQKLIMQFYFSQESLRFYNGSTPENRVYGWEKLLNKPKAAKEKDLDFVNIEMDNIPF